MTCCCNHDCNQGRSCPQRPRAPYPAWMDWATAIGLGLMFAGFLFAGVRP